MRASQWLMSAVSERVGAQSCCIICCPLAGCTPDLLIGRGGVWLLQGLLQVLLLFLSSSKSAAKSVRLNISFVIKYTFFSTTALRHCRLRCFKSSSHFFCNVQSSMNVTSRLTIITKLTIYAFKANTTFGGILRPSVSNEKQLTDIICS